jgi:hypothetical protein
MGKMPLLTLLLHIWGALDSNLSGDQPSGRFSWYSSVSPGKCWDSTLKLVHDHILSNSSFPYRPFIRQYTALSHG